MAWPIGVVTTPAMAEEGRGRTNGRPGPRRHDGFPGFNVSPAAAAGELGRSALRRTRMDENRFWSLIESAWQAVGGKVKARRKLAEGKLSDESAEALVESLEEVIPAL